MGKLSPRTPREHNNYHGYTVRGTPNCPLRVNPSTIYSDILGRSFKSLTEVALNILFRTVFPRFLSYFIGECLYHISSPKVLEEHGKFGGLGLESGIL